MFLYSQSISYFNFKISVLSDFKGYQNGNHIEPSEHRLQEISFAKNCLQSEQWPRNSKASGSNPA